MKKFEVTVFHKRFGHKIQLTGCWKDVPAMFAELMSDGMKVIRYTILT